MKKSSLKYQKKETNFVPSYVTSPLLFILSKKDDLLFGEKNDEIPPDNLGKHIILEQGKLFCFSKGRGIPCFERMPPS